MAPFSLFGRPGDPDNFFIALFFLMLLGIPFAVSLGLGWLIWA